MATLPSTIKLPVAPQPNLPAIPTGSLPKAPSLDSLKNKAKSTMLDPDDPTKVNSIVDVLSNTFDPVDNEGHMLRTFVSSTKEMFENNVTEPLKNKDYGALFFNNLIGLGETVDLLATPIKSLLPTEITTGKNYDEEITKNPWTRFKSALGIGVEGRYSYDWDVNTGNKFLDNVANFAGELISDPINWITLGAGGAIKSGATGAAKEAIKEGSQTLSKEALDVVTRNYDTIAKTFKKDVLPNYLKGSDDELTKSFKRLEQVIKASEVGYSQKTIDEVLGLCKDTLNVADDISSYKASIQLLDSLEHSKQMYQAFVEPFNKLNDALTAIGGMPWFTPSVWVGKKSIGAINFVKNRLRTAQSVFVRGDLGASASDLPYIRDVVRHEAAKINATKEIYVDPNYIQDMINSNLANDTKKQIQAVNDLCKELGNVAKNGTGNLEEIENTVNEMTAIAKLYGDDSIKNLSDYADYLAKCYELDDEFAALLPDVKLVTSTLKATSKWIDEVVATSKNLKAWDGLFDTAILSAIDYNNKPNQPVVTSIYAFVELLKEFKSSEMIEDTFTRMGFLGKLRDAQHGADNEFIATASDYKNFFRKMYADVDSLITSTDDSLSLIDSELLSPKQKESLLEVVGTLEEQLTILIRKRKLDAQFMKDLSGKYGVFKDSLDKLSRILKNAEKQSDWIRLKKQDSSELTNYFKALSEATELNNGSSPIVKKVIDDNTIQRQMTKPEKDIVSSFEAVRKNIDNYISNPDTLVDEKEYANIIDLSYKEIEPTMKQIDVTKSFDASLETVLFYIDNGKPFDGIISDLTNAYQSVKEIGLSERFEELIEDAYPYFKAGEDNIFELLSKDYYDLDTFIEAYYSAGKALVEELEDDMPNLLKNLRDPFTKIVSALKDAQSPTAKELRESAIDFLNASLVENAEYRWAVNSVDTVLTAKWNNAVHSDELLYGAGATTLMKLNDLESYNDAYIAELQKNNDPLGYLLQDCKDKIAYLNTAKALRVDLKNRIGDFDKYMLVTQAMSSYVQNSYDIFLDADTRYSLIRTAEGFQNVHAKKHTLDFLRERLFNNETKVIDTLATMTSEKDLTKAYDLITTQGHKSPLVDGITTELSIRTDNPDLAEIFDGFTEAGERVLLYDIETNGMNFHVNQITQFGIYEWGSLKNASLDDVLSKDKSLKVNYLPSEYTRETCLPTEDILQLNYEDFPPEQWEDLFKAEYYSAASEAERISEADLLLQANGIMNTAYAIVGQNNTSFDDRWIKYRLSENLIISEKSFLDYAKKYDAYEELLAKDGKVTFSDYDKQVIDDWLSTYALAMISYNKFGDDIENFSTYPTYLAAKSIVEEINARTPNQQNAHAALKNLMEEVMEANDPKNSIVNKVENYFYDFTTSPVSPEDAMRISKEYGYDLKATEHIRIERNYEYLAKQAGVRNIHPASAEYLKFKEDWFAKHGDPTSMWFVMNERGSKTSKLLYKKAMAPSDSRFFKVGSELTGAEISTRHHIAEFMATVADKRILHTDLVIGPGKLYKDIDELKYSIEIGIKIATKSNDPYLSWVKELDMSKIYRTQDLLALNYTLETHLSSSYLTSPDLSRTLRDMSERLKRWTMDKNYMGSVISKNPVYTSQFLNTQQILNGMKIDTLNTSQRFEQMSKYYDNVWFKEEDAGPTQKTVSLISARLSNVLDSFLSMGNTEAQLDVLWSLRNSAYEINKVNLVHFFEKADDPDYLLSYLTFRSPFIEFKTNSNYVNYEPEYANAVQRLLSRKEELEELGIKFHYRADRVMLTLDFDKISIDNEYATASYLGRNYTEELSRYENYHYRFPERLVNQGTLEGRYEIKEIWDAINEATDYMNDVSRGESVGGINGLISLDLLKEKFKDYGEVIPDNYNAYLRKFFDIPRTDLSSIAPINLNMTTYSTIDNRLLHYSPLCRTLDRLQSLTASYKNAMVYAGLWFNDSVADFSPQGLFKGLIDTPEGRAEIAKSFPDDYVAAALVKQNNTRQPYRAITIQIDSAEDVLVAQKMNAKIIPFDVYLTSFDKINNNLEAMPAILHMARKGMAVYKVGYLSNVGSVFRNAIDSTVKAVIDTKDPANVFSNVHRADKLYHQANDVIKAMYKTTPEMHLNNSSFRDWFEKYGDTVDIDYKTFKKIFMFFMDGPSSGQLDNIGLFFDRNGKMVKKGFFEVIADKALYPMAYVERTIRLAQFLQLEDAGYTKTQIFKHIAKSQFDYSNKTRTAQWLETIIPFYNFTKLNFEFWLDVLAKDSRVVSVLNDYLTAQRNAYDVDFDEVQRNQSLQYYINSGAIPMTDDGLVLKVNPSFLDVLNVFTDPKTAITDKLFAPIADVVDGDMFQGGLMAHFGVDEPAEKSLSNVVKTLTENSDIFPILGAVAQRRETSKRNAERLPSHTIQHNLAKFFPTTFGAVLKWEDYESYKKYMKPKNLYGDKAFNNYNIPRRTYNYYGAYQRRYYPKHSKAYWYAMRLMNTPAYYRARVNYY